MTRVTALFLISLIPLFASAQSAEVGPITGDPAAPLAPGQTKNAEQALAALQANQALEPVINDITGHPTGLSLSKLLERSLSKKTRLSGECHFRGRSLIEDCIVAIENGGEGFGGTHAFSFSIVQNRLFPNAIQYVNGR